MSDDTAVQRTHWIGTEFAHAFGVPYPDVVEAVILDDRAAATKWLLRQRERRDNNEVK